MKMIMRWGLLLLLCTAFLTGCTNNGRVDEGNIACVIELEDVPEEFTTLREDMREKLEIEVHLWNQVKDRSYAINLSRENGFRQEAMLNPGIYQVRYVSVMPSFLHFKVQARENALEVGTDKSNDLSLYVTDPQALARDIQWMEPSEEILLQDRFSRMVQWKGELIAIRDIRNYVEFTYEQPVPPYQQAIIGNGEDKIGIVVMNETDQPLPASECVIQSVTFNSVNAVLPGGVMVGTSFLDVVHKEKGSYGTPQSMTGSILYGVGLDQTGAVYLDPESGDKITVKCSSNGKEIVQITYSFAAFE